MSTYISMASASMPLSFGFTASLGEAVFMEGWSNSRVIRVPFDDEYLWCFKKLLIPDDCLWGILITIYSQSLSRSALCTCLGFSSWLFFAVLNHSGWPSYITKNLLIKIFRSAVDWYCTCCLARGGFSNY